MRKIKVRCPHCVHDFEVEVPKAKSELKQATEIVQKNYEANQAILLTLQLDNENLKYENQRLNIINHYHRSES